MENLSESLNEAVCIEDEVFFGPIAEKEKKIKEHFENVILNENKPAESRLFVENDISRNDSLYKSFSVDESKYNSFDDSLNEEVDIKPQETKYITLRKSFDKLKSKQHGFYDSLEDVCSLVSNFDKCSISCEVENNSHFNNKHVVDDSLKNPSASVVNKSNGKSEQIHLDDDSLAILEFENTFDDSLEEINDICNIDIEEIDDIENVNATYQNIAIKVEQNPTCLPRNLFDTSVQIVYEKKWGRESTDQEGSSDDKNIYDSLSNSDFKDILKDSLEESGKFSENLNALKFASDVTHANSGKSEQMFPVQNMLDASVQIVYDNFQNVCQVGNNSELNNSQYNDFSKDSLENYKNVDCDPVEHLSKDVAIEYNSPSTVNDVLPNENTRVSNKKSVNSFMDTTDYDSNANQSYRNMEDSLLITEPVIPISETDSSNHKEPLTVDSCHLKLLNDDKNCNNDLKLQFHLEVTVGDRKCQIASQEIEVLPITDVQCKNDENISIPPVPSEYHSQEENLQSKKCDDISTPPVPSEYYAQEENLQSKKCDDISTSPVPSEYYAQEENLQIKKDEAISTPLVPAEYLAEENDVLDNRVSKLDVQCKKDEDIFITSVSAEYQAQEGNDTRNSKFNNNFEKYDIIGRIVARSTEMSNENSCENPKSVDEINITHREKSSGSQFVNKNSNNISLLQALDLHDISASFLNESIIQSNDSLMPLNLCCRDVDTCLSIFREESKENFREPLLIKKGVCTVSKKTSPNAACASKMPKRFQTSPCFKDLTKKTPGTKIPVRKVENFAIPTSSKLIKQVPITHSAEKVKKCHNSPASAGKKAHGTNPDKTPHFCRVRNTIFSKVPQIVPSKKYMNIQSPVAQYISGKSPRFDQVLRDCMNQPMDSPYSLYQTAKTGTVKSAKKKA